MIRARAAWPGLALGDEIFLPYLASRASASASASRCGDMRRALHDMKVEDLYLAAACAQGDAEAIALLRARCSPKVRAALLARLVPAARIDDIEQALYQRLFCPEPGSAPLIEQYSGRGALQGWLCIVAIRLASRLLLQERREVVLSEDALLDLIGIDPGSELTYLKHKYRGEFRAAFQAVLLSLSSTERNVLRYHVLGGLTTAQIGVLTGVSSRTVKRWMAEIRDKLLHKTRDILTHKLGVTAAEVESIIRLIQSDLNVSLERLLRDDPDPPLELP